MLLKNDVSQNVLYFITVLELLSLKLLDKIICISYSFKGSMS